MDIVEECFTGIYEAILKVQKAKGLTDEDIEPITEAILTWPTRFRRELGLI